MHKTRIKHYALCIVHCALLLALVVGCKNESEYPYETQYLPVQLVGSEKWSILDVRSGELVVKDAYDVAPSAVVNEMYYVMNDEGTFDYYNVKDPKKPVNREHYGSVTSFGENGLAIASHRGGPLEVIDKQCEVVKTLPKEVAQCTMFNRGMAAYQNDQGLWGFINEQGDTAIAAQYAQVHEFLHNDRAIVVDNHQDNDSAVIFTIIDKTGKRLFEGSSAEYQLIQPFFVSGVLPVVKGDTIVCLNDQGKEVPNPNQDHAAVDSARYDDYTRTAAGLYLVLKNRKMGLVDRNNQVLIKPQFDRLVDLTADRYIAITDTVCHLVDQQGKAVGSVKFVHVNGGLSTAPAARGFIDTDLAVASMMMLFGPDQCCGAGPKSTLMDLNSLLESDPTPYVGLNHLNFQQGPFIIQYMFNNEIASVPSEGEAPTFNLDARVMGVLVALNLAHTGVDTEPTIVRKAQGVMGTRGFVLEGNGIFTSEAGPAISMGYDHGLFNLYYFMSRAYAQQLPQNQRK